MKDEEQKNNLQKQMLINRLYKTKNNPVGVKPPSKNEDDTKLLFYVCLFLVSKPARNPSARRKTSLRSRCSPGSVQARSQVSRRTIM